MSSLKCANCGFGIHYHGEADNVEFIVFTVDFWESLMKQNFKNFGINYNPKADELELLFPNDYRKFWLCPSCNTCILFEKNSSNVESLFTVVSEYDVPIKKDLSHVIFNDVKWDLITESNILIKDLQEKCFASYYVVVERGYYYFYNDSTLNTLEKVYVLNPKVTNKAKLDKD